MKDFLRTMAVAAAMLVPAGVAWAGQKGKGALPVREAWPGQAEESKPIDPKPPVLKQVRWQYLHKRYQDVYIDGSGRAWFLIRTFPTNRGGKRPPVFLTCPELPEDHIEIPGYNLILGFDSKDRFWEVREDGLRCTDVRTGKVTQRRPAPGIPKVRLSKARSSGFGAVMLKHSSGRLYFLDTFGVHVLENDKWKYHEFSPDPTRWSTLRMGSNPHRGMKMAEGPRGRVFLWGATWDNLRGVWVHDKATWKHYSVGKYPLLERMDKIVPLKDGTVEVYWLGVRKVVMRLGPGATSAPKRKKTSGAKPPRRQMPIRNDKSYLARVLAEELSLYGSALGKDRRGRVYFAARDQEVYGGYVRIAVFDPRYKETAPTLKYKCFRIHQVPTSRALAVDSQGRIWARLRVKEHPFLSRYDKGKWTHFPDPAPSAPLPGRKLVLSGNSTWTMKPFPGTRTSWRFDPGRDYPGLPGMANPTFLQSLRNGCMLASEADSRRAFLFDGKTWHAYNSLRTVVERRHSWLLKHVDNEAGFWRRGRGRIGRDATGRIWVTDRWEFRGAYDGKQWQDIPKGSFIFNKAGDRCMTEKFVADTSVRPPKELSVIPDFRWKYPDRICVCFDSDGRVRQADRFRGSVFGRPGIAILKDSSGRFWFVTGEPAKTGGKGYRVGFKVAEAGGKMSQPYWHPYMMGPPIVEQGKDVFWAAASDGLLRLRVVGKGAKMRIVADRQYPRIIPQGPVEWMTIARDGALWMSTRYGESGLYRIEIPPLDKQKD